MAECAKCGAKFGSARDLRRHLDRKRPCDTMPPPSVWCEICGRGFTVAPSLSRHRRGCRAAAAGSHSEGAVTEREATAIADAIRSSRGPVTINVLVNCGVGRSSRVIVVGERAAAGSPPPATLAPPRDPPAGRDEALPPPPPDGEEGAGAPDPHADPAAWDNFAIRLAAYDGHAEDVALLLADPRVDPTAGDNCALQLAAERGHAEVVALLLADPRVDPAADNNLALMSAALHGHAEVVALLLADPRVDPSGLSRARLVAFREAPFRAALARLRKE
jgi:hypothetical protein